MMSFKKIGLTFISSTLIFASFAYADLDRLCAKDAAYYNALPLQEHPHCQNPPRIVGTIDENTVSAYGANQCYALCTLEGSNTSSNQEHCQWIHNNPPPEKIDCYPQNNHLSSSNKNMKK